MKSLIERSLSDEGEQTESKNLLTIKRFFDSVNLRLYVNLATIFCCCELRTTTEEV